MGGTLIRGGRASVQTAAQEIAVWPGFAQRIAAGAHEAPGYIRAAGS